MKVEIIVPDSAMPKKDPERPCACQFREFHIENREGEGIYWLVDEGAAVKAGQVVCEGEIEKKTLEFYAPCDGVLEKILVENEGTFKRGDVLGIIEDGK